MTRLLPRRSTPRRPTRGVRKPAGSLAPLPLLPGALRAVGLLSLACLVAALLAVPQAAAQAVPQDSAGAASSGAASSGAASAEPEPRFFEDLDDLPLMAGLQEMEEAGLAFDKPGGRIGEVYAEGGVPAERVRRFYRETLPQLGWQPAGESRFVREREQLFLQVSEAQGTTTLRLSLFPLE